MVPPCSNQCSLLQVGAYCRICTKLVRMHELAQNLHQLCALHRSLILRGKTQAVQGQIAYLLMVKCWHSFCYNRDVSFFNQENTNGKDRRRCNADAEG
jgi:hypothetical protein